MRTVARTNGVGSDHILTCAPLANGARPARTDIEIAIVCKHFLAACSSKKIEATDLSEELLEVKLVFHQAPCLLKDHVVRHGCDGSELLYNLKRTFNGHVKISDMLALAHGTILCGIWA